MTAYASVLNYSSPIIQSREAERFSAGDTLTWKKWLPTFLPSDGWSLLYVLTDENAVEQCTITSLPGSGDENNWHVIDVDNFMPTLAQGSYILTGYAVNGAQRRQIYYGWFYCTPDFVAGTAKSPQTTFAQQMITALQSKLIAMEAATLKMTEVQRNRFEKEDIPQVLDRLKYWMEKRRSEIQVARSRNGLPPGNVAQPLFNIG